MLWPSQALINLLDIGHPIIQAPSGPIPAALNRSSARWHRIETEQRLSHHLAKLPSLMIGSLLDGVVVVAAADASEHRIHR